MYYIKHCILCVRTVTTYTDTYTLAHTKALDLWEEAYTEIEKREHLLAKLEAFEKTASDPSRLFTKSNSH